VRFEVASGADQREAVLESAGHGVSVTVDGDDPACWGRPFFRGKLDGLLPGHHLVTTDTIAEPELVIADISGSSRRGRGRVAGHPDRRLHEPHRHRRPAPRERAGFDQVLAKSALQNRCSEVIEELLAR
jgi:hypothetical protein